jgi:hypothetical protein
VIAFLEDLGQRARPFGQKDYEELKTFAREKLGLDELKAWDSTYASEKLREQRYAFGTGSEAILPRAQGGRRPVPGGAAALRRADQAR